MCGDGNRSRQRASELASAAVDIVDFWVNESVTPTGVPRTWFDVYTAAATDQQGDDDRSGVGDLREDGVAATGRVQWRADTPYMGHLRIMSEGVQGVLRARAALQLASTAAGLLPALFQHNNARSRSTNWSSSAAAAAAASSSAAAAEAVAAATAAAVNLLVRADQQWLAFAVRYGDFLVQKQSPDGSLAGEVRARTRHACCLLFLLLRSHTCARVEASARGRRRAFSVNVWRHY